MEQVNEEITEVKAALANVEAEIQTIKERLDAGSLSKEDVIYWRKQEEQLRKEKEQLRKEKEQLREKELFLLKHQAGQGRPPLYPAEGEKEIKRKLDLLLEHTRNTDRATPQYSAAFVGNREKARLKSEKRFNEFEERVGEESILTDEEQEALSKLENEHQVVAFLTPHLEKVFCNGDVDFSIFNSEEYKWIETSSETSKYNEKPDLLICHPAIINQKPAFNSQDPVLTEMRKRKPFKYGVLSKWRLRDAIGLTCEAKISIDSGGFGEVINYGAHLCFGKNGSVSTRLILFDKTQCWLVGVVKGSASEVTTFKWRDGGTTTLLRDFIRVTPLTKVLTAACKHFGLTVGTNSFLGAGAFGFVFRATRSNGKSVALKVVAGLPKMEGVGRLEQEMAIMSAAQSVCPDEVMGVEEDGFAVFEDGGALLLSQVGDHYSKLAPQAIVDSLKTLHKSGLLHGDARLDNVVCVDGRPVWVDFADSMFLPAPMPMKMEEELEGLKVCVTEKFGYNAS
uniref:Protein kinase domain-containing protein n=1 Tax=Amphora coffeiformis TaxID=265554 RepID=A0A7S3P7P5_9STRA|eukprot:scaffold19220_cov180-Amphora_coffeaeformis.AAC.8